MAALTPLPPGAVRLRRGLFHDRFQLNRKYMLSLKTENLLQNHYHEAGLWSPRAEPGAGIHWGWESPTCQVRGHFLGHWLSGAASIAAVTGDQEIRGKADYIVSELARCQRENGGEWVGPIPEKYLDWAARGKPVWAPHYTLHKTLMGLWDMYAVAGNAQALEIINHWARWFHRWSSQFTREQLDHILDVETGGMLEVWANLYGATGERAHRELIERYDRRRLFDPLRLGQDVLTNMHMNTTIPEVHGAARAWEVTGEPRWREIVEAYWRSGVTERGSYVTGGQTNGEVWSPPGQLSSRLGFRTQEHCTVYNMMRLADYLLRWSGDTVFADYWESCLWNGILAQQHPDTGMIAYFLPLHAGAQKVWGSPTEDFWCCHGSLVQAPALYASAGVYTGERGELVLTQWIPADIQWQSDDKPVKVTICSDPQLHFQHMPNADVYTVSVDCDEPHTFDLRMRIPTWTAGNPEVFLNGNRIELASAGGYLTLRQTWNQEKLEVHFPRKIASVPLPDDPHMVAFRDGPVVLAGLNPGAYQGPAPSMRDGSHTARPNYSIDGIRLTGDIEHPERLLTPDNEREWMYWRGDYRTRGQARDFRLIPLYEVRDEVFTVYFSI